MSFRSDFPIFDNNPDLVFFDSTASSQKPKYVIDGISDYLSSNYSNIHRGMYDIAINSEKLYVDSKKKVAKYLGASDYKEVIYSFNSTYAINLLVASIKKTGLLQKGDVVLLSIAEHHANIVPWLILKEEIEIEVKFVGVTEDYSLDIEDFLEKYDESVKIIALTHVSNVTGKIFDLEQIGKLKRDDTLFIVDASQSVPHFAIDVAKLNCDALFFTGHKIMSDSGIGVLWAKRKLLEKLDPAFSGGGSIGEVTCKSYTSANLPDKFEPGTPNMTGAVSLLKAYEYIESIGGFSVMQDYEDKLVEYFLEAANKRKKLKILGPDTAKNRVGVFSLYIEGHHSHDVAEIFAENNIAVRSGKHCAHPLYKQKQLANAFRASLYIYNTKSDIDKFFQVLDEQILN